MWGSGGTEGEGLCKVKESVTRFFLGDDDDAGGKKKDSSGECELCLERGGRGGDAVVATLSEEVVGVVLTALLPHQKDANAERERRGRQLWLCVKCTTNLTTFTDLFLQLAELRRKFSELRRSVGRQVILGSLGKSEEALEEWEKELRRVEDPFPLFTGRRSGAGRTTKVTEKGGGVGGAFGGTLEDDVKLKKMTPVVLLERLKENSVLVGELMEETFWFEEQNEVKVFQSEGVCGESKSEDNLTSIQEPRRVLRKRRSFSGNSSAAAVKEEVHEEDDDFAVSDFVDEELSSAEEDAFAVAPMQKKSRLSSPRRQKPFTKTNDEEESKSRFQCPSCPKSYGKMHHLVRHQKDTHEVSKRQCPSCPELFSRDRDLLNHRKLTHGYVPPTHDKSERQCAVCSLLFRRRIDLQRHHKKLHPQIPLKPLREFCCSHCDLSFYDVDVFRRHKLKRHLLGSTEEGNHQCPFCLRFFEYPRTVRKHQKMNHFGGKDQVAEGQSPQNIRCFVCDDPPQSFLTAEELKGHEESPGHVKKLRASVSVHCNVCRINFRGDLEDLQRHLKGEEHRKEVEGLGNFDKATFCVPCRATFETSEEQLKHIGSFKHSRVCEFRKTEMERPLDVPVKCGSCHHLFEFQSALDRHVLRVHPSSGHTCKLCGLSFARATDFHRHKVSHSEEIRQKAICDKCGKRFESGRRLNVHLRTVHNGIRSTCNKCGKSFPTQRSLERHLKQSHPEESGRSLLVCPHCEEAKFKKGDGLRKHLCVSHPEIHLKETPHACLVCFHAFSSGAELEGHMASHAHLKCPTCSKQCNTKTHLRIHARSHTEEKTFKCPLCEKQFKSENSLTEHLMRHEGRTPHECGSCGEGFWRKCFLEKHTKEFH